MERRINEIEKMQWQVSRLLWDAPNELFAWNNMPLSKEISNLRAEFQVNIYKWGSIF